MQFSNISPVVPHSIIPYSIVLRICLSDTRFSFDDHWQYQLWSPDSHQLLFVQESVGLLGIFNDQPRPACYTLVSAIGKLSPVVCWPYVPG